MPEPDLSRSRSAPTSSLHRHYAILEYDGSGFAGWQIQPRDRTVQGEFERALAQLAGGRRVPTTAAGRTDAGVHALGQVVSFEIDRRWDPARLRRALDATTPPDLRVVAAGGAPADFHARRDALARRYRYVVGCDRSARSPFRAPFEWALGQPLDPELLDAAAAALGGTHDFRALSLIAPPKPDFRCTLVESRWRARADADGFIFTVEADRFLHRMVRFLVGVMVDIARHRRPLEDLELLLHHDDNRLASPPAPPQGLYLVRVRYGGFQPGTTT